MESSTRSKSNSCSGELQRSNASRINQLIAINPKSSFQLGKYIWTAANKRLLRSIIRRRSEAQRYTVK